MNIEDIKESFTRAESLTYAHWLHGLWTGRSIEADRCGELCDVIDRCREDAIVRIKKVQQAASEEV